MRTFGVAIEVPEPYAEVLRATRADAGDPEAHTNPPHVTVVAPVSIDPDEMVAVEEHLAEALRDVGPFRMRLRGTGTFRPVTPVVFVAVADGIGICEEVERRVRCGPLALELRFPYHPHVTIAAEVDDAALDRAFEALALFEAEFLVDAVKLYELADSGWTLSRSYPLGSG
ncbi:MAG: 2'-5' RNA ligase family protein [Actinomycetota bacterium]